MRKLFGLSALALFALLATFQFGMSSCTKEIITHDTVTVIHKDTIVQVQKDTLIQIKIDTIKLVNSDIPNVNAGGNATIQLQTTTDSIRLSGSATEPNATIVSYLWSQVSGPNTGLITNPGAAATYVTKVVAGTYVFQLMAIDNHGATGVKTVSIIIKNPDTVTLNLQPNHSTSDVLLAIVGGTKGTNPNAPDLDAAAWTVNGAATYIRGLLKFDFSSIPSSAKIVSAKLSLYSDPTPVNGNLIDANFGTNNAMLIQRATSNWNSTTIGWLTQPSTDAATQVVIPHTSQSRLDLLNVDVTNLVKDMQQYGNYGFLLKLQNEEIYNSRLFCSSKHPDTSKHPKLVIQYNP